MRLCTGFILVFLAFLFGRSVSGQTPQINLGGMVNGASFAAGLPITPGSIASAFGANFGASMAGVTLQLNGISAPLFAVAPTQINFQVPWELAGQSQASVTVTVGNLTSNAVTVSVGPYAPGLFVANSLGQGAILAANTASLAAPIGAFPGSQPVSLGGFISIYATGIGPVANQPATGAPPTGNPPSTTISSPTVTIGGVQVPAAFAGLAPGFFGLYQINVQVPSSSATGAYVPVTVSIGGVTSNRVTVAITSPPCPVGGALPFDEVLSIAVDPANPENVYTGTESNGVYKSCDGGVSWTSASSGFSGTRNSAVVVDPNDPQNVYAISQVTGFFKSLDGAKTWNSPPNSGLPLFAGFSSLIIDPSNTSTLYMGNAEGVFKSINGGTTWTISKFGLTNTNVEGLAINPKTPTTLYALEQQALFTSINGGQSWSPIGTGLPILPLNVLAIDPLNPNTLYFGTYAGVFKSVNGGQSWTAINSGLTAPSLGGLPPSVPNVQTIAIDPVNSNVVYAGTFGASSVAGNGVFKSTNGGQTWTAANNGLTTPNIQVLAIDPTNTATIYAGTDAGIFKTTNGAANWGP